MPAATSRRARARAWSTTATTWSRPHPWVSGVKTGHTLNAGYVLVGAAAGRGGAEVISVVLGEPSEAARDADTLELLRWGLAPFHRVRALDPRPRARARRSTTATRRRALVPRRAVT